MALPLAIIVNFLAIYPLDLQGTIGDAEYCWKLFLPFTECMEKSQVHRICPCPITWPFWSNIGITSKSTILMVMSQAWESFLFLYHNYFSYSSYNTQMPSTNPIESSKNDREITHFLEDQNFVGAAPPTGPSLWKLEPPTSDNARQFYPCLPYSIQRVLLFPYFCTNRRHGKISTLLAPPPIDLHKHTFHFLSTETYPKWGYANFKTPITLAWKTYTHDIDKLDRNFKQIWN